MKININTDWIMSLFDIEEVDAKDVLKMLEENQDKVLDRIDDVLVELVQEISKG